jgi:hypothetical protein
MEKVEPNYQRMHPNNYLQAPLHFRSIYKHFKIQNPSQTHSTIYKTIHKLLTWSTSNRSPKLVSYSSLSIAEQQIHNKESEGAMVGKIIIMIG